MTVVLVFAVVSGLLVGSFLTAVVDRVPGGDSVVAPRSRCATCGHRVRNRHNIPVVGWVALKGRCADCRAPIGGLDPLLELGTPVLFVALVIRLSGAGLATALPAYCYFFTIGIALAVIDLKHHRLPDSLVLPAYPVTGMLLVLSSALRHDVHSLGRAVGGGLLLFGAFLALAVAHPRGMGFGDVKLSGVLGGVLAYLSWPAFAVGVGSAFLLGALIGGVLLATGRAGRSTAVPFGPFMIAGGVLGVLAAEPIAAVYVDLLHSF
jgi:leader peptidase (prepilin peptidase)/N-methyltransferase